MEGFLPLLTNFKSRAGQRLTLWLRFINFVYSFVSFFLQSLSGFALLRSRCFPPFFVYIFAGFLLLLLSVGQLFRPKRLWSAQCVHKGSRMAGAVGHLNGLKGSKMGKAD